MGGLRVPRPPHQRARLKRLPLRQGRPASLLLPPSPPRPPPTPPPGPYPLSAFRTPGAARGGEEAAATEPSSHRSPETLPAPASGARPATAPPPPDTPAPPNRAPSAAESGVSSPGGVRTDPQAGVHSRATTLNRQRGTTTPKTAPSKRPRPSPVKPYARPVLSLPPLSFSSLLADFEAVAESMAS